jgi:heme-degrading monooxygenase HmoA
MICRLWRGWTTPDNAAAYEQLLRGTIIPRMIEARHMGGFRHIDVLRRDHEAEAEFTTLMWFDSLDAVRAFVGDDVEQAHVPEQAQRLLSRFDERVAHHEVLEQRPQVARD